MQGPPGKPTVAPTGIQLPDLFKKPSKTTRFMIGNCSPSCGDFRTWRHLTRNSVHPILVITDHANLQYYREPQKLGPRVNGYVAELAEYHIALVYKPGAVNRADELSRRPDLAPH